MSKLNSARSVWPWPRIVAHRGGGALAPENTLAAIRKGIEYGYRAVEFDVMLAADDVPVLMHDPDFGRTIHGHGSVAATRSHVLTRMDAGAWFGQEYAGEPVPLYADIVRFCRVHGVWMNVEIKPAEGHERRTGEVVGALTAALFADEDDPARLPLFSSFADAALEGARSTGPKIARGLLVDAIDDDSRHRLNALGCVALHCNHEKLDAGIAARISRIGYGLFVYTVNDAERVRELFDWGVDALCTDRIDRIDADPSCHFEHHEKSCPQR